MKRVAWFCLAVTLAAADTGTAVRSSPSEYEAHQPIRGGILAASELSQEQAAKTFSGSVAKNFVVIEVAVFPETGKTIDIATLDFSLKTGQGDTIFAVTPEEAAWHGKRPPSQQGGGPLSPGLNVGAEVGIAVGTRTDPTTGRTQHGVGAYGGAGVDNYPRPAPSSGPATSAPGDSTYVVEGKLRGYELQEGPAGAPISGYLYFPAPKKRKGIAPVLEYSRSGERARLTLPAH